MKVYTSYYGLSSDHPNAVSISIGTPKGFKGRHIKGMKPTRFMIENLSGEPYKHLYRQILDRKEGEIIESLHEGDVLLCWEKPPKECHRHYAAEWLREHDIEVEEIVLDQTSLF